MSFLSKCNKTEYIITSKRMKEKNSMTRIWKERERERYPCIYLLKQY